MILETEFDLGQEVHVFARKRHELFDLCPQCGGAGKVVFAFADGSEDGKTYCPNRDCHSGRVRSVWLDVWEYAGVAHVGQIEVKTRSRTYFSSQYEERYMLDITGVGSGTVYVYDGRNWSHTHLFATEAEGQAWAAEENVPLRAQADEEREQLVGAASFQDSTPAKERQ